MEKIVINDNGNDVITYIDESNITNEELKNFIIIGQNFED